MTVSMLLFLSQFVLDIFASGKRVNYEGEYGVGTPAIFYFYGHEQAIKLVKK